MDRKLLPMAETFIKTFPKDANAISILLNHEKAYPWLMNNFIQLTSYNDQYLDFYDFNYRNCPILECQRIKLDLVKRAFGSVQDFFISAIERGNYIYLPVKREFIAAYQSQGIHDMLIYGYDKQERCYFVSDYFQGHYSKRQCDFCEMEQAIEVGSSGYWFNGFRGCIELLSYSADDRAVFEEWRVKRSIEDYLVGVPTSFWYESYGVWTSAELNHRTFGIDCYKTIYQHLEYLNKMEYREGVDAAFLLMAEHKKMMYQRFCFMKENGCRINDEILEGYSKIKEQAEKMRLLRIKQGMVKEIEKKEEILKQIYIEYLEIEAKEKKLLKKYIE